MIDSAQIRGVVRKAVAALAGLMLAVVLLTALLITGFYLLVQAALLALAPVLGQPAAMTVVGASCVLLLLVFFWRMASPPSASKRKRGSSRGTSFSLDSLRELIRENPLEAALAAFAAGVAQQGDPRLRSLLMQGGMELMKRGEPGEGSAPGNETPQDGGSTRR
ncbi:hypothetical protein QQF73_04890 [Marinobacter sp. M216]|uniref:Phage holin family protein n=1 Tax=Marinobacter albus TaxID=3030833 RepID=A0ABT7H9D0_9GAMM|nr:hypothetical protein [Marinobacter sp. M216]MDK9556953.1 hypothetical protein [Marinobacter sp. M216]